MLLRCQLMAITLQMSIHHFQARKSNVRVHIAQPAACAHASSAGWVKLQIKCIELVLSQAPHSASHKAIDRCNADAVAGTGACAAAADAGVLEQG